MGFLGRGGSANFIFVGVGILPSNAIWTNGKFVPPLARLDLPAPLLEKAQGATRLGATGLRASEKKSASQRVSERTSENL